METGLSSVREFGLVTSIDVSTKLRELTEILGFAQCLKFLSRCHTFSNEKCQVILSIFARYLQGRVQ